MMTMMIYITLLSILVASVSELLTVCIGRVSYIRIYLYVISVSGENGKLNKGVNTHRFLY